MENNGRISVEKGVAPIKKKYVATHVQLEMDSNLLSCPVEDSSKDQNKRKKQNIRDENESKTSSKKKMKGMNKNRRNVMHKVLKKLESTEKMCRQFCRENQCPFGDNCTYSHDLNSYASYHRKCDIGNVCPNFSTFGKCDYGILCRFGSSHLKNGKYNLIDEEKYLKVSEINKASNILAKNIQIQLRKKKYDFTKSNSVSQKICSDNLKVFDAKRESRLISLKKRIDFNGKLYLAPLTTLGNLPFRRICKEFGADVTCGEMALCTNILEGSTSEWALLRRHSSEDLFGVQLCGANADQLTRCAQLICQECDVDFIDLNMGCPIDLIYRKGAGSALMERKKKLDQIIYGISSVADVPLTLKMRTGVYNGKNIAKDVISSVREWQNDRIGLITLHGRSREQRYTKLADWNYIKECTLEANQPNGFDPIAIFGSGDVLSQEEYYEKLEYSKVNGIMIGRGALIKPWIFTEIREKKTWDISSQERFEIIKKFVNYGLANWGSDTEGVEKTRCFLLEWLSFLYRYIPVGLLERLPQRINERPPRYFGRNDLETLMSSASCNDWISISEMLLGKVPQGFTFIPKHKANSY